MSHFCKVRTVVDEVKSKKCTINPEYYSNLLKGPVREALRRKRPGKLIHGVLFHHDNARPHTAKHAIETLGKLGWEVFILPIVPNLLPVTFIFLHTLKLLYVDEDYRRIWR
ncbi:hypothetical protein LAZ67_20001230 [Cordylochernes scorpioides]|uniref:Histone-lysine N-methyltransferase SETMAR n=1 Tax=Cordylochernes scorpioides TaxID=51811 RepID=A0ABY6LJU9_9ARAC|nr:hypothetical protein LAZ67_20001230 [Cordylochernes scorpioides]